MPIEQDFLQLILVCWPDRQIKHMAIAGPNPSHLSCKDLAFSPFCPLPALVIAPEGTNLAEDSFRSGKQFLAGFKYFIKATRIASTCFLNAH